MVGWMSASCPFAKLTASSGSLSLRVRFAGDYSFRPNEVVSIREITMIPLLAWGIRIEHCKPDYPKRLIFWAFQNPKRILGEIQRVGFQTEGTPSDAVASNRGFAIRWQVIVIGLVLWNGLFMLDARQSVQQPAMLGPLSLIALVATFAATVATLRIPNFQRLVLKAGRKVGEVRHLLNLLAVCTGAGSLMLLLFLLVNSARN